MYLADTTLAPKGSWRETKIEYALIFDIACAIAGHRNHGDQSGDREHHPEAERMLRLFIAREGRYPHDGREVEAWLPPGYFENGITLRVVSPD
jgi:hypothetical protein